MRAFDTLRENFAVWHAEMTTISELATAQARAMAPLIAEEGRAEGGIGPLRRTVLDILGKNQAADALSALQGVGERLAFTEALLAIHPTLTEEILPTTTEQPQTNKAQGLRIAMMRATASADAAAKLNAVLGDTTPLYCNSFAELCERVGDATADLALLPIEDATEGMLRRSYHLFERFELHIACTVEVPSPEGGVSRIALLYHDIPPTLSEKEGEGVLECRTLSTEDASLTELLTVANACALALRRIDTHTTEDGEEQYRHIIFRAGAQHLLFATYLALFLPRTVITERYLHFT